jgi:hypothetical protein
MKMRPIRSLYRERGTIDIENSKWSTKSFTQQIAKGKISNNLLVLNMKGVLKEESRKVGAANLH